MGDLCAACFGVQPALEQQVQFHILNLKSISQAPSAIKEKEMDQYLADRAATTIVPSNVQQENTNLAPNRKAGMIGYGTPTKRSGIRFLPASSFLV